MYKECMATDHPKILNYNPEGRRNIDGEIISGRKEQAKGPKPYRYR